MAFLLCSFLFCICHQHTTLCFEALGRIENAKSMYQHILDRNNELLDKTYKKNVYDQYFTAFALIALGQKEQGEQELLQWKNTHLKKVKERIDNESANITDRVLTILKGDSLYE